MAQFEKSVRETINTIATKEKLENYAIELEALTTDGANYSSALYKATVKSSNHEDVHMFAKIACVAQSMRDELKNVDIMFELERVFYSQMVPKYEAVQSKHAFSKEERFRFPKYYGSNANEMEETIVLEDLVAEGYALYDRLKPLSWSYASKAAEELAKFHALSFACQYEHPELFENVFAKFNKAMVDTFTSFKKSFESTASSAHAVTPGHLQERVQRFIQQHLEDEMFEKYYGPGKWKVLVHGDYRASNIMHKEQDGEVTCLIPVDYQTLHLGSPSTDLIYLIYTGTDEEFRRYHLHQLKDLYYETLAKWLRQMNLDPDRIYSRKDFEEDYSDMLAYGLRTALFLLPMVLVEAELAPVVSTEGIDVSNFSVKASESFRNRFVPMLNEFVDLRVV